MNAWLNKRINSIWQQRSSGKNSSRRGRRSRLQDNGGFTLVELIVVLIVLGILVSLAVMGLSGWQDYADFKQNNEAAKSIFVAAQTQLTQYGERGQLTALIDAVSGGGKASSDEYLLKTKTLKNENGTIELGGDGDNSIWQEYAKDGRNVGNIYYLMADKGDYKRYQELKDKSPDDLKGSQYTIRDRRIRALFDMIDLYVADKSMLDAAICIEFDPDPKVALVYSVFYNNKVNSFTYESGDEGLPPGTASIQSRTEKDRRRQKTGYYGADTLAKGTDTYLSKPIITDLRLNNKETLNLSWKVLSGENHSIDDTALTSLMYTVTLYDMSDKTKQTGEPFMQIMLGKADKKIGTGLEVCGTSYVTGQNTDGTYTYTAGPELEFPVVYSLSDGTLTLVLDGLDLSADETTADLDKTASIQRLMRTPKEDIRVSLVGKKLGVYDTTTQKRSNTEHAYFGSAKTAADGTVIYTIDNMRHFNNIRYREAEKKTAGVNQTVCEYQISSDLNWKKMLLSGNVYESLKVQYPEPDKLGEYYFKPILSLSSKSALTSGDEKKTRVIGGLSLSINHMQTNLPENGGIPTGAIGLFVVNKGSISNLTLNNIQVDGVPAGQEMTEGAAAGGFCARNEGTLKNLTVLNEDTEDVLGGKSLISGISNVGGIAGEAVDGETDIIYENLINRAQVKGQLYVGGIVGKLEIGRHNITVDNCENYGQIQGAVSDPELDQKNAYFIGGIAGSTGYGSGYTEASGAKATLKNCKSSPYYTDEEIEELLAAMKTPETADTVLIGNYVGGIVGYNNGAEIEACGTIRESVNRQGYVVGRDYVGGIVGYNSGDAGLNLGADNRNQAHVMGRSYVGGVVGCNAIGRLTDGYQVELLPKEQAADNTAYIKGWINEGIITAVGDYAGGITGYNADTGKIENSYSNIEYETGLQNIADISSEARFAGGVAGYNKGQITNTLSSGEKISVVSVIRGKDYVGGVVGLNDVGGTIENYELQGGYIEGERFVGGFVGLNLEEDIFKHYIQSNPNKVTGNYFVGGVIGGNLISIANGTRLQANFRTDNFLGELSAQNGAYAGGFIGYNYLLKDTAYSGTGLDGKLVFEAVDAMIHRTENGRELFVPLPEDTEDVTEEMAPIEAAVEELLSSYADSESTFIISSANDSETTQDKMGTFTGRVYIGGVVGFNHPSTHLEIRNVENITPVEAVGYIARDEKNYSYVGGIIGKVEKNVLLFNCRNRDVGTVRTKGTYTGGLAELNYGRIEQCTTGSIGDSTMDYVGGLVGVNGTGGEIIDCVVSGQITGGSYVGGLASENYGTIQYDASMREAAEEDAVIDASGTYAGGLVGYAYTGGKITIKEDEPLCISVQGSAVGAGGIAGANGGEISGYGGGTGGRILNAAGNSEDNTEEQGTSIVGRKHVGGFIGLQIKPDTQKTSLTLRDFENQAYVQASSGYAGGIAAIIAYREDEDTSGELTENIIEDITEKTSAVRLENCSNYGIVEVLSDDTDEDQELELGEDIIGELEDYPIGAGGITAVNYGLIDSCGNYAPVRANSGAMGGIAAVNINTIKACEVGISVAADSSEDTLELSGGDNIGGIAAVNEHGGVIKDSAVRNLILRNQSESRGSNMGGIVGRNGIFEAEKGVKQATIENCFVGIDNSSSDKTPTLADYSVWRREAANYVSRRYAAGNNAFQTGESDTTGNTVVLISNAADVNMGGVAGLNDGIVRGEEKGGYHTIAAAELKFFGNSLAYFGNMGGIVGYNGGTIRNYEFHGFVSGSANDPSDTPGYNMGYDLEQSGSRVYGYGGIAGRNGNDRLEDNASAKIQSCYLGMAKIQGTGDSNNRTNVGGVAGFNGKGAEITDITFSQAKTGLSSGNDSGLLGVEQLFRYTENNKVYSGSVWVNATGSGHVGGVAGYNHGTISDINWSSKYEENRQETWIAGDNQRRMYRGYFKNGAYTTDELAEVDSTGALVTTVTGHVGGIAGYNRRTGLITKAVTGRNWLVYASAQEENNGAGGIIGYNISERDLVTCDNHASVVKRMANSNSVGGIAGRNENSTSSSWRYYDCHNYGTVTAAQRAGGMIGQWKYRGGMLEKCLNFGKVETVQNTGTDYAAGMVGMVYAFTSGETINIVNSENHGSIAVVGSSPAGGFIGGFNPQTQVAVNIYDSINTGTIRSNGASASGFFAPNGTAKLLLQKCRNYGYVISNNNNNFKGISARTDSTTLKDCFGITDIAVIPNPLTTSKAVNAGGYYFDSVSVEPEFWVNRAEVSNNVINPQNLYRLVDDGTEGNIYFNAGQTGTYTFWLSRPVKLTEIQLNWYLVNERDYTYNLEYQIEGSKNNEWINAGSTKNHTLELDGTQDITAIRVGNVQAASIKDKNQRTPAALLKIELAGKIGDDNEIRNYTKLPRSTPASQYTCKNGVFTWSGPKTADDKGNCLIIRESASGNTAETIGGVKILELGTYTINDIKNAERTTNSSVSWQLCKGTEKREGMEQLLNLIQPDTVQLKAPAGLKCEASGGDCLVSWTGDVSADYYVVRCEYSTGKIREYTVYTQSLLMPSTDSDGNPADSATITVTAHRGTEEMASEATEFEFGKPLPFPQIRWELVCQGQNKQPNGYRVVLVNAEEYKEFADANGIDMENIIIKTNNPSATLNGKAAGEITFPASEEGKKAANGEYVLYASSGSGNTVFTSYAAYIANAGDSGKKVQNSSKVLRESMYPVLNAYDKSGNTGKFADVVLEKGSNTGNKVGFAGKTIEDLQYRITIKRQGNIEMVSDFRTELVADDPVLGVPVAWSVSKQTKVSSTTNAEILVQLGDLPADFLDKVPGAGGADTANASYKYKNVMVRAYPTKMSNDIVYQGWEVQQDTRYSASELNVLRVTDSGKADDNGELLIDGGKLKTGYVIEYAGNDQYTLYFNALLKALQNEGFQNEKAWLYNSFASYMREQVFYHRLDLDSVTEKTQPVPVLYANAKYGPDPDDSTRSIWSSGIYDDDQPMVLTWDQSSSAKGPAYVNEDGNEPYQAGASYILNVSGVSMDANGAEKITVLVNNLTITTETSTPAYNTYTFDAATVKRWNFAEIRGTLTRVGVTDNNNITTIFPSTTEFSLPMRRRLPQVQGVKTELLKKDGVVQKDGLDYTVSYLSLAESGASAEEIAALDHYEVTVQSKADEKRVLTERSVGADDKEIIVNLQNVFDREERVSITVRAVAKADSAAYRDGPDSAAQEMQVPRWLVPPQMGKANDQAAEDNMTELEHEDAKGAEAFTKSSIKLHMKKENYTANVNYQIAMELYDSKQDAEAGTNPLTDASQYLPGRESGKRELMSYDSVSGYTYALQGLPIQYAGKFLRVVLRAQGSSNISSVWTDEQNESNMSPGEENVLPYKIFRLPDVQVAAVELETGELVSENYPVLVNGKELINAGVIVEVEAKQYSVQYDMVDYAQDYRIIMIQSEQPADKKASPSDASSTEYMVQDVNEMTLTRESDSKYSLQFRSTERDADGKPTDRDIELTVDGPEKELPCKEPVILVEREENQKKETLYIEVKSYVQLISTDSGGVRVVFTMPDIETVSDTTGISLKTDVNLTEQILVQSIAEQNPLSGKTGSYRDSDWAWMVWDAGFTRKDSILLDDDTHKVKEPTEGVSETNSVQAEQNTNQDVTIHDVVYYLKGLKGDARYLVSISDEDGREIGIYGVPYVHIDNTWGGIEQQIWFPVQDFAKYATKTVTVKFRSIFDTTTGGVSGWSEKTYKVDLPELPDWVPVELKQQLSAMQQYEVAVSSSGRSRLRRSGTSVTTQKITARQYQVSWNFDPYDMAVTGYDLLIHGADTGSDYRLKLDLNRGWFGSIPGLEDYLTEDGKLLYAVAYNLDGDVIPYLVGISTATASDSDMDAGSGAKADSNAATGSDAATDSNAATATDSDYAGQPGTLALECRLKAAYTEDCDGRQIIRFTLTLPDASFASLKGSLRSSYLDAYEDGLYQTEKIQVTPEMASKYYPAPEPEWFYLEKWNNESEEPEVEENSEDGFLENDLN